MEVSYNKSYSLIVTAVFDVSVYSENISKGIVSLLSGFYNFTMNPFQFGTFTQYLSIFLFLWDEQVFFWGKYCYLNNPDINKFSRISHLREIFLRKLFY